MNRTIVTILLAAALVAAPSAPFAGESEVTNEAFEVGKNARLSLSNLNGPATIVGGSGNKIEITATKRTSGSLERLEDVKIRYHMNDDYLRIEADYRDTDEWEDTDVSVEFEIRVPRGITIQNVELVNGSLDISNISGGVEASSVNGDVEGRELAGEVDLSTVNGDVSLSNVTAGDPIELGSVNGTVSIHLPKKINARLSASTVHGDISGNLGDRVTHAGGSMDAVLGSGGVRIQLGTVNGDIRIRRDGDDARKRDRDSDDDSD